MLQTLLGFTFLIPVFFVLYCLHYKWKHRSLNRLSTAPGLPIIGHAHYFHKEGLSGQQLFENFLQYGDVLRMDIGPCYNVVLVCDAKMAEFILGDSSIQKPKEYSNLEWIRKSTFLTKGDEFKKRIKWILRAHTNKKILEEYVPVYEKQVNIFLRNISAMEGKPVNIWPLIEALTLDVYCESVLKISPDAQKNVPYNYMHSLHEAMRIGYSRIISPWKCYDLLFRFSADYSDYQKAKKVMKDFVEDHINRYRTNNDGPYDALEYFLNMKIPHEHIVQEINSVIMGGAHTMGPALSFALFELAENPKIQQACVDELKEICRSEKSNVFCKKQFQNMIYLESVIKETLRMYPPVCFVGKVSTKDIIFDGTLYPKNVIFGVNVYGIHRNPKIWENPDLFDPSRFLPANINKRPRCSWIPFSAGSRGCVGQNYAIHEMKTVLSRILMNYELLSAGKLLQPEPVCNITAFSKNGVHVIFKCRKE